MNIASSFDSVISNSVDGGRGNVGNVGTLVLDDFRNEDLEQLVIVFSVLLAAPSPILDALQYLVIATPESESRVVPSSSNLLFDLLFNICQKLFG